MRVIRDLNDLPNIPNAVITTGTFDGVHLGHKKLITKAVKVLVNQGLSFAYRESGVYTRRPDLFYNCINQTRNVFLAL